MDKFCQVGCGYYRKFFYIFDSVIGRLISRYGTLGYGNLVFSCKIYKILIKLKILRYGKLYYTEM